jgi:signal transduction histidine kinase
MWTLATQQLNNILFSHDKGKRRLKNLFVLLLLVLPVLLIGAFSYLQASRDLSAYAYARRQALAYVAAATLKERLDHLQHIGLSLATRVRFRQLISEGKWDAAAEILRSVPNDFPFIDRLFLTDPKGTLTADMPALPAVRGRNFSFRDWYQGVSQNWQPYVSNVYKRTAEPQLNVIAVAVPIKTENQSVIGILVLQLPLNALLEWVKGIDVGPSGFVYIVDRVGRIATHPKFALDRDVIDFSTVPSVRKALSGQRGIEVAWNPIEKEERLTAYEPVPGYGWGVIVQEPTSTAFEARDVNLRRILIAYGLIVLVAGALAFFILRAMSERERVAQEIGKLNEDLKQKAVELEAANKELEAFSYSVSHDLRAPLRAIDGFARILMDKHMPQLLPEAQRYLKLVRDNATQMGELIDDLLAFSRLSRQPLKRQPVNPGDLARQVLQEIRPDQNGRHLQVSIGDLPPCQADPALLKQVFTNFLSNALKFTRRRDPAQIDIGSLNGNGEPVYFVKDNGVGFDMKYADKLFAVFQRLHRAEEYEGTGVGLAIVQRVIHRHGGRVWVEAETEKGATFYFTLGGTAS